jgi:hypothetical protein
MYLLIKFSKLNKLIILELSFINKYNKITTFFQLKRTNRKKQRKYLNGRRNFKYLNKIIDFYRT